MSHASSSKVCKYDIFLSFRGEDTRRTFVSHLYKALEQRGIHTFKDDERLEAGQLISAELLKAIEEARFAVVIFSKSYASSRCRHAFRERSPKEDFMELSRQVVKHAGGLPLALKVLGSSFYRRDKKHWRHIIDRLKRNPHKDILGKLRLSFDGLDKDEKELFLDIVFLEIAYLSRYDFDICVEQVQRYVSRGFLIDYLIEKSLLSIDLNNSIVMHNMIREMGENVIQEEYANSRIWLPEEVCDLFKGKLVTEKVESLCIPEDYYFEDDAKLKNTHSW
ncbi:hypothetical protein H5410_063630 [Solanum commersonii]|uniref:TIR domain-containing protein n=1 Tax=Solanum commersonii TaxID=4109 RepID=A0A9J5WFW1_SOLCO|nr:hypothetical protein H5410_063630 [Solanum commersonii]